MVGDRHIRLEGEFRYRSDRGGLKIEIDGKEYWFPEGACRISRKDHNETSWEQFSEGQDVVFSIPESLAEEKGIDG